MPTHSGNHSHAAKYVQIREELAGMIRSGLLKPGEQIPTESELAGRYGCSRPTAVRALQDLVSRGTLVRQQGKGTYVAQMPPELDREERVIVLVSPFSCNVGSFTRLPLGAGDVAKRRGYRFQVEPTENEPRRFTEAIEMIASEPNRYGLLMVPLFDVENTALNERSVRRCIQAGVPTVLLNHRVPGVGAQVPFVGSYNQRASYEIAKHLIDQGHERIAFIRATAPVTTDRQQYEGYLEAMREHGVSINESYVHTLESHELMTQGFAELDKLMALKTPPTAIMCCYDFVAANIMHRLLEMGHSLPEDMAIAGFGDDLNVRLTPTLTTAKQPATEMAAKGCETLIDLIEGNRPGEMTVLLDSKPIFRNSTARGGNVSFRLFNVESRGRGIMPEVV